MEEMLQFESRDDKHQVKKRAVYEELAAKFSEANFHVSWEAVQKKWQNLMSTYWRNLKKPKKESQWEYFAEMDNILRNTSVWVGLNGCKDPKQSSSLHYKDQIDDRLWNNERIIFLLDEMRHLHQEGDVRGRRSIFHKISTSFQRIGVDLNWKLIQKKWHNLMTTYKRNLAKPRNEVAWELFDMIDNILNKPGLGQSALHSDDVSRLSMSPSHQAVDEASDDALWTHDNTLWLMEEMKAVKERKDKHLLKNRVVFREIADAFNEENFMVDWKKVLRKWQTMYVVYSKIYQGLMQPSQWQYFERMHDIVGDTDMYVGIGSTNNNNNNNNNDVVKTERDECVVPSETVYHYINPEDNSQFIMTCSEALQNSSFQVTCKPLDSRLTSENHEQFVELSPEFVTADYVGSGKSESPSGDHELTVQFNAVDDSAKFTKLGTISVVDASKPSLNRVVVKGKLPKRAKYHLDGNETKSIPARNGVNGRAIEEWNDSSLQANPDNVNNTFLLSSGGDLVEQTVVLEDGVVFEEHLDPGDGNKVPKAEYIEIEMAEVGAGDECIEVQCDGAVSNSFDREVNSSNEGDDFEAVETAFEISEVPYTEEGSNLPHDFRVSSSIDSSVPVSSGQFWNC